MSEDSLFGIKGAFIECTSVVNTDDNCKQMSKKMIDQTHFNLTCLGG